ncbi:MAG: hypothetical protein CSA38_03640 [Flavobacteriales bacterium]|nr:MAG: hypothetical protein CSA38_03640 [Flavobacteriales bacterium]
MKRVSIFLVVVFLSVFSQKINAQQTVTVTIENIASEKGKIAVALFNKQNFLKMPVQGTFSAIKDGKSTAVFKNVPKGEYAIGCFHDENNNYQLERSENGMPLERYGFSNTKKLKRAPVFDDMKFSVEDEDVSLSIELQ